ncbi:MAG: 4Fe-4S binding protein [Desulfomonilia bacterium]
MPIPPELQPYALKLGFPESEAFGKILSILFDDEDCRRLAQAMPGSISELSGRTGITEPRVREIIEKLKHRGAVNRILTKGETFRLFPAMIELRDSTVITPDCPPELFSLWENVIMEDMPKLVPMLQQFNIPPMLRVIPIEETVESTHRVLDMDSARVLIRDASLITAIPCPCRTQSHMMNRGERCIAPKDVNLCMQINGFAEAALDRGVGERITATEAFNRIAHAEEAGLVHTVRNNVKDDMFMCNCCSCCCTAMLMLKTFGYGNAYAPSRFRAVIDESRCTGCGVCEPRCQFGAISVEETVSIDGETCFGCGNCVLTCPTEAIVLEEVRPPEFIRNT